MVYHDHDRIIARRVGKVSDKIHRDLREGAQSRGRDGGQGRCGQVGVRFHLLAGSTAVNVISNKGAHGGPPVVTFNQLLGTKAARVAGGRVVVVEFEDALLQGWGNIGAVLEKQ